MSLLTFPLPLASFFQLLPISSCRIDLPEALDVSETAGGQIIRADLGTALWSGQIDLSVMTHNEAAAVRPLINVLRRAGASFLVSDMTRAWPRLDPNGAILGASIPLINSVGGSGRELSLKSLPAAYVLSRGDMLSFEYGAGPRYALHEVIETVTASGSGVTPLFEVNPPVRPGAAANAVVQLVYPRCKAVLTPGATDLGVTRNTVTRDATLSWSQTLR